MKKLSSILIMATALFYSHETFSQSFKLESLKKKSVNTFNTDGKKSGKLHAEDIEDDYGKITIIGYDPSLRVAEILLPNGASYFIEKRSFIVDGRSQQQWEALTSATSANEPTICFSNVRAPRRNTPTNLESKAAKGLSSCLR